MYGVPKLLSGGRRGGRRLDLSCGRRLARLTGAGLLLLSLLLGEGGAAPPSADPASVDAESPRSPRRLLEAPLSISVVSREEILRSRPALGLEDALDLVPGAFVQSSLNFAQDTRLSVRGFGARSTFGIRGLHLVVDGVPSTLPDGQTEVDSLDLAFVERIEVVRGPISSLYGGGAGGTISVRTLEPTEELRIGVRSLLGSDHLTRHEATWTDRIGITGLALGLATTRYGGHRDHSRGRQTTLLAKLEHDLADGTELGLRFSGVWGPEAQDPGGLRPEELAQDPTQAHPNASRLDTGERLHQQQVSLRLRRPFGPNRDLRITLYRTGRSFRNALPFTPGGRIDFDRSVTGGSMIYTDRWRRLRWMVGADVGVQSDIRKRWDNDLGGRGALALHQSETVRSIGPFGELEVDLGGGVGFVGGLRYDWTEFVVGDRLVSQAGAPGAGDQSGRIRFRELSPRIGIHYGRSSRLHVYANLSTAFQVPTTTELAPASGVGGFSSDLEPERSLGVEVGIKGILTERLVYDLAAYGLRIRDALVPFEDATGRTFARNVARIDRAGFEVGLSSQIAPGVQLRAAYTYIDSHYRDFDTFANGTSVSYDGNEEPNIPRTNLSAELRLEHPSGLFAVLVVHHRSSLPLDDANLHSEDRATTSDAQVGFQWERGAVRIRPFAGVRNWTDVRYAGTTRPNARFRRFVEPAAEIQGYAGLSIELSR